MAKDITKKTKSTNTEKGHKDAILMHLKKYNKLESVDIVLVDEVAFMLTQIDEVKENLRLYGVAQKAKSGWMQKSAYMTIYSDFIKNYLSACNKLGLSPFDRQKWEQAKEKKSTVNVK